MHYTFLWLRQKLKKLERMSVLQMKLCHHQAMALLYTSFASRVQASLCWVVSVDRYLEVVSDCCLACRVETGRKSVQACSLPFGLVHCERVTGVGVAQTACESCHGSAY